MPNRAAASPTVDATPFPDRVIGKLLLLLLSVALLTLSFAPYKQFYLAWVGLVPWLYVVRHCRSQWRAFFWSWLGGVGFFVANMWWLAYVTVPGMIALVVYLGLYWALAAVIVRGLGWIVPQAAVAGQPQPQHWTFKSAFGIALIWTALEWVRGNFCTGLPWLYLGHTQSPALATCQIADLLGVYGVTFWVVLLNATLFHAVTRAPRCWSVARATAALLGLILIYGVFRAWQTPRVTTPGPRVLVVQPNYPQDNSSGAKGSTEQQTVDFHVNATAEAIRALGPVDLACWSETMMPPINPDFRALWRGEPARDSSGVVLDADRGASLDRMVAQVTELCSSYRVNVLTGGLFFSGYNQKNGFFEDRRNSAYLFRNGGTLDSLQYDKVHLVPFGEFMPFRATPGLRWVHAALMKLSPYGYDYTLTPGSADAPTVFRLNKDGLPGARVVTPICFEDIDAGLCAKLIRGPGQKRADLIVNMTNDGWFRANENAQHLQAAVFRAIENRAPLARTVNTGVSALIDSYGHVTDTVPVRTEGVAVSQVRLDPRYTLFTRVGDLFAWVCTLLTTVLVAPAAWRGWLTSRKRKRRGLQRNEPEA